MDQAIYSLMDAKAGYFGTPFFAPTDGHATRSFFDLVADDNTVPGRHPEDFVLYRIGTFNSESGAIENGELKIVANGSALAAKLQQEGVN